MVNGEKRSVAEETTVSQLLETLRIAPERVVVELNLTILKRAQHQSAVLQEGDHVEIVHFVGGGSREIQRTDCKLRDSAWSGVVCHES